LYNNVPCVGHANAHVVEAMARAQSTLNVHSRYLHRGILISLSYISHSIPPGSRMSYSAAAARKRWRWRSRWLAQQPGAAESSVVHMRITATVPWCHN
jgi:hypothetical protein